MSTQGLNPFELHDPPSITVARHFAPGFKVIKYQPVQFDLRRVRVALFDSTYHSPITLPFPREQADKEVVSDIAMTVEVARALYDASETNTGEGEECPDWYVRGIGMFTAPSGDSRVAPMHTFLRMDGREITRASVRIHTDELGSWDLD